MGNLEELARRCGIQDSVPTSDGNDQFISDETRRALLQAMGWNAADEEQAATCLGHLEEAEWERPLPPVIVAYSTPHPLSVAIVLPGDCLQVQWRLTLEDQSELSGRVDVCDLELLALHEVKGTSFQRRVLCFREPIPLGYHTLRIGSAEEGTSLIVTPGTCWVPATPPDERRLWGVATQVYLLRSGHNWGIGDYTDLRELVEMTREQGADLVGVNPLHAMFLDKPEDASPYSPSDRLLLNVLNLDLTEMPELAHSAEARDLIESKDFQRKLAACRESALVDYEGVAALKLPVLRHLFKAFSTEPLSSQHEELNRFHEERRELLDRACTFQALRAYFSERDHELADCKSWPAEYQSSDSPAVQDFAVKEADRVRFQLWLQWSADRQLQKASEAAQDMVVGLYRDLAVGSHSSGAEAWSMPGLFCRGVRIGAPPDLFNPAGQNWGLPPLNPHAMQQDAYKSFANLIRANMRYAGALRIDHVMALRRLYWIPDGGQPGKGGYVHYPLEDLVGIIALESHRNRCLVIGEDLGGVPDGFRERMAEAKILSYRVLSFERTEDGFNAPQEYPHLALSVAGNHDLPTLPAWWTASDLDLREKLRLFPSEDGPQEAREMRDRDRKDLLEAFRREGLLESDEEINPTEFGVAAHLFLARTRALLTIVQLDDVTEEPEQVNMPGTSNEYPNWRRKLSLSLEQLASQQKLAEIAKMMQLQMAIASK